MTTVFIGGSIKIRHIHPLFAERLKNVVYEGLEVIVGDASGADTSVQEQLLRLDAKNVNVFCSGNEPRNNVGSWKVERVYSSDLPDTCAFFTAKDVEMAYRADFGLMLWDAVSTGTLNNVFELLSHGRKTVIFVNPEKRFVTVKERSDFGALVSAMTDDARWKADRKINLSARVSGLMNQQASMHF